MYSYDRTASGLGDLKTLSPKFNQALKKAISEEKSPVVKDALKEAARHFEMVMDNLEAAEHEEEESTREAAENRQAARLEDLERPAQDLVNMCRDLYRLVGRIESAAKRMKAVHPELAVDVLHQVQELDGFSRRLSMRVDEALGLE